MTEPRRSRTAWPGPLSTAGVGEGHAHDLPPALIKRVRLLTQAVCIVGGCLVAVGVLLTIVILSRSAERDQQQEETRKAFCTVFDTLPEGGVLDDARRQFDCGPGRPLDSFPDDVRRRYEPAADAPAPAAAPTPTTQAPMGAPAVPNPPRPTPNEPPAGNSPKPTPAAPTSPPPDDSVLTPVTDEVCDLTGICLEEPR